MTASDPRAVPGREPDPAATRTRLDAGELAAEIGPLTIPPPMAPAEEQAPMD